MPSKYLKFNLPNLSPDIFSQTFLSPMLPHSENGPTLHPIAHIQNLTTSSQKIIL